MWSKGAEVTGNIIYICLMNPNLSARIMVVNKSATYIRYGGSYTNVCILFTGQEVFCYMDRKYVGQQLVVICLKMLHVLLFLCKDNPPFTFFR